MGITDGIAGFAARSRPDTIPSEVLKSAKRHVVDTLGVALAATRTEIATILREVVKGTEQGESSLWSGRGKCRAPEQARFSLEYAVAVTLLDGAISLRHFDRASIQRAEVQSLMKKVHVYVPPELRELESRRNRFGLVTVRLSDGSVVSQKATRIRGHPPLLLSDEEVDRKFFDCADPVLGRARAQDLLETLRRIETVSSVREIFPLLGAER